MKVNGVQSINGINSYNRSLDQRNFSANNAKGKQKDTVDISLEAKELHSTQNMAEGRTEKLQSLREAVSSGTYYVDSRKIAERLLPFI